jgi:hypothetical protein
MNQRILQIVDTSRCPFDQFGHTSRYSRIILFVDRLAAHSDDESRPPVWDISTCESFLVFHVQVFPFSDHSTKANNFIPHSRRIIQQHRTTGLLLFTVPVDSLASLSVRMNNSDS